MTDITRVLSAIEQGESESADRLLPLVYEELRRLAVRKLLMISAQRKSEPARLTKLMQGELD